MPRPKDRPPKAAKKPATDYPTYWFFVLEDARQKGNAFEAEEAWRELCRLGVTVIYGNLGAQGMVGATAGCGAEGGRRAV
jgi:hypothetical protein